MKHHSRLLHPAHCLCALITLAPSAQLHAQHCEPHWSTRFHALVVSSPSYGRVTTIEGPTGPLVLSTAGGARIAGHATGIVAYDGTTSFPLAGGLSWRVRQMIRGGAGMHDLYVLTPPHLATWNRSAPHSWNLHPIGQSVLDLIVHDDGSGPSVFATGYFSSIGGTPANGIARWNGQQWISLSGGLGPNAVNLGGRNMTAFDDGSGPALFVGGVFRTVQGAPGDGLAKWDGAAWHGVDVPAAVNLLATFDDGSGPRLYAIGTTNVFPFSRWENPGWTALSTMDVSALSVMKPIQTPMGPRLVINGIHLWDGTSFTPFPGGELRRGNFPLYGFAGTGLDADVVDFGSGPELFVQGNFQLAGTVGSFGIARNDGTRWLPSGLGITHGWLGSQISNITSFAVLDEGSGPRLYAGGNFGCAGGQSAASLARYDGDSWTTLNPHTERLRVQALQSWDDGTGPTLFAGLVAIDTPPTHRIRRYRAGQFMDIPAPSEIRTLRVLDLGAGPRLVAGCTQHVAIWNGSTLETRQPPAFPVNALAVYDDGSGHGPLLYAAGANPYGSTTPIARWIGIAWQPLPGPQSPGVIDVMHVHGEGPEESLYLGGSFNNTALSGNRHVARWNGEWSPVSGPGQRVFSFATFDDGRGPALYAGTSTVGSGPRGVLRLINNQWEPVIGSFASGNSEYDVRAVLALQPFIDEQGRRTLFAGGDFHHAAGIPSFRIAQYIACPEGPAPCYANCDGSTIAPVLGVDDFTCFINSFAQGIALLNPAQQITQYANCDGSTTAPVLNIDDFTCFIDEFARGCP
jgi:hypothetical protein